MNQDLDELIRTADPANSPDVRAAWRPDEAWERVRRDIARPRRPRGPINRVMTATALAGIAAVIAFVVAIPHLNTSSREQPEALLRHFALVADSQSPANSFAPSSQVTVLSGQCIVGMFGAPVRDASSSGLIDSILIVQHVTIRIQTDSTGVGRYETEVSTPFLLTTDNIDRQVSTRYGLGQLSRPPENCTPPGVGTVDGGPGVPAINSTWVTTENSPQQRVLITRINRLPTDLAQLLPLLRSGELLAGGHAPLSDADTFVEIANILTRDPDAPPSIRSSLYSAAATLHGVLNLGNVTDRQGRRGEALALTDDQFLGNSAFPEGRIEIVIAPQTSQILEEEELGADHNGRAPVAKSDTNSGWIPLAWVSVDQSSTSGSPLANTSG
jgi:hypothetical protein